MNTRITYMGRRIDGRYDSFKAKMRRLWIFTKRATIVAAAGAVMFALGGMFYSTSSVSYTAPQIVHAATPVLDRIADCESGNGRAGTATHYGKNGQVLLKANKNGTIDIGKYQVNLTYWGAKASELGYDLTKEEDNKKMAQWIYENKGTTDWSSSMKCWYNGVSTVAIK